MSCFAVLNQKFRVFAALSSESEKILLNFPETPICSLFTFVLVFNLTISLESIGWMSLGPTGCWRRCLWCTRYSFLHFFLYLMKSHSFASCRAEKLQSLHQALLLMNCLLASELCLWSVPCFERMHSASMEQMRVLSSMKDVLRCRHTCLRSTRKRYRCYFL